MAEAARSLQPAPTRPPLRAVPPPRGPSRAVIRRRRLVAMGGLAGLIGLPLAVLALGTGPGSDREQIGALLTAGAAKPATLCDHLSGAMLRATGGHDACVAASPERGPGGTVESVRIRGEAATAVVVREDGDDLFHLVRENGAWKIDDVG
jgi:hypothetical protein